MDKLAICVVRLSANLKSLALKVGESAIRFRAAGLFQRNRDEKQTPGMRRSLLRASEQIDRLCILAGSVSRFCQPVQSEIVVRKQTQSLGQELIRQLQLARLKTHSREVCQEPSALFDFGKAG